jgi:hypothetical protein
LGLRPAPATVADERAIRCGRALRASMARAPLTSCTRLIARARVPGGSAASEPAVTRASAAEPHSGARARSAVSVRRAPRVGTLSRLPCRTFTRAVSGAPRAGDCRQQKPGRDGCSRVPHDAGGAAAPPTARPSRLRRSHRAIVARRAPVAVRAKGQLLLTLVRGSARRTDAWSSARSVDRQRGEGPSSLPRAVEHPTSRRLEVHGACLRCSSRRRTALEW